MRSFPFLTAVVLLAASSSTAYASDTLEAYARKCDQAIGITVPDFVCSAGTPVPTTHPTFHANGILATCDRPNRLNRVCDPGSHFQVLRLRNDSYVVAHCRRKGLPIGQYGDIAVIQHNAQSGATCFYQALGQLPDQVKAPSKGQSAWPWYSPSATAGEQCGSCHDNGPLIRSPYLAQLAGPNALPGAGDNSYNKNQPYHFIGEDFASWKAYRVEIKFNTCNGCHRMGTNNLPGNSGTALDFGIRATDTWEISKNPHSTDSPIWMTPGQITYDAANAKAAQAIRDCAFHRFDNPLPNSDSCSIAQFTGAPAGILERRTQPDLAVAMNVLPNPVPIGNGYEVQVVVSNVGPLPKPIAPGLPTLPGQDPSIPSNIGDVQQAELLLTSTVSSGRVSMQIDPPLPMSACTSLGIGSSGERCTIGPLQRGGRWTITLVHRSPVPAGQAFPYTIGYGADIDDLNKIAEPDELNNTSGVTVSFQ